MDIKLLPANSTCLVDANILLYHIAGTSADSKGFLQRVANEEVQAYLTTIIIAEALHRQMLIEAAIKGLVTPGKTLNKLKANPAVISTLTDYIAQVEKLLQLPFVIAEVTAADIAESHKLRRAHGLFVNDSINLACAPPAESPDCVWLIFTPALPTALIIRKRSTIISRIESVLPLLCANVSPPIPCSSRGSMRCANESRLDISRFVHPR